MFLSSEPAARSPVVTHRFSYKDLEQGFNAIKEGNCGKAVLDFEEM